MSAAMRTFFGGLLVGLSAQWTWGQDTFGFDGVIRHFAVGTNSVYVVTDDRLYQLGHKLTLLQTRYQRGLQVDCKNMDGQCFHKVSEMDHWNATFTVNTLLPFIENNTLITCGKTVCGYCELLDLNNISKIVHEEIIDVGSVIPKGLSVGILVDLKHDPSNSETYILTAQANSEECKTDMEAVTLYNTLDQQKGGIFSKTGFDGSPRIRSKHMDVEFVDGFQINTTIFLFSILPSVKLGGIRLIWLQSRINKLETFKSLAGATLNSSEAGIIRTRLLSSSVIPGGPPVHWAGVFSANDTGNPVNTVLAIYDINLPLFNRTLMDPDFCPTENCDFKKFDSIPDLKPMIIVFKYSSMTSVLAVKKYTWVVFIIGTGDGQLIKIAVDKSYKATCPQVFHLEDNASPVFRTMYLDPVDPKYVYVALTDQMKRIPLAKCGAYNTLDDCWNAQDPFCGWCETTSRCTFEDECLESTWMSISQDPSQKNMVSYQVEMVNSGQGIKLTLQIHLSVRGKNISAFSCNILPNPSSSLSYGEDMRHCYCVYSAHHLSAGGLKVSVRLRVGKVQLVKKLILTNCSAITGPPTYALCQQCITAGCSWNNNVCSWTHNGSIQDACQINMSGIIHHPVITSVTPNVLSLYGSNSVLLSGINLSNVTMVRMQQDMACSSKESHVWNNTGVSLMFRVPAGDKGIVRVCAVLPDGSCHGSARITYGPSPVCTSLDPDSSWASGKRIIGVKGLNMKFVDFVSDHNSRKIQSSSAETLEYPSSSAEGRSRTYVSLRVANQSLACPTLLTYHPDPTFISFTSTKKGNDLSITIQKKADSLHLRPEELHVLGVEGERQYNCVRTTIEPSNETDSVVCEIPNSHEANIQFLKITYGDVTVSVDSPQSFYPLMLLLLLLFPLILGVGLFIYFNEQKKHREQMNDRLEMLECDIRKEIRQGFVDLQTEKSDLIENNGAIPFLDYKHFASRIFFPEGGSLVTSCIKDIGQDGVNVQPDEPCQNLSKLIQNPLYLTSMIHALEEQKGFTVKDKCAVASLLTVALHGNLPYLTQIIEELLRNLMEKANTQPKLMLRRTESIVEKLLTNWMSICLYGFLRESVGQHLFLLVSALSQQIAKGPVDSVTEKALYTLNEDWLLWQAQDFSSLKLMVLFAVGTDGEVSEPLEVNTLDCDTVEQVKEKILMAFNAKFGFPYNTPLRDLRIEYERDKTFVALNEVDASSVVIGDVTMLNTLKHYKIPDGASIKVISRGTHPSLCHQSSVKEDENFSTKYFHLIDPEVYQDQERNPERKKIKLKEVHLTKLLSTKVAIHSFVENLFKTIWGTTNGKAPHAVKFFFDFLDAQADGKKISDPDVLHIWKTNSLPLRFWVNILKNPQFVFDMEKTPHMDSCLSVIAQAFMDSFSLSENQLGKHAPTNKLLYAKDIPQYKQEVKAYYKQIRDQPPITNTEFKDFLLEESKKHDNEFNESVALRALYKYVHQYFNEIKQTLEQNEAPAELTQQLQHVKIQFDSLKSCSWH